MKKDVPKTIEEAESQLIAAIEKAKAAIAKVKESNIDFEVEDKTILEVLNNDMKMRIKEGL